MGLSARFSKDPEIRSQGPLYAVEAKKLLKDDLEHICVENIQACILIGNICLGDSDPDAESLYFVLANRMAQILTLGVVNPADDGVTRETKTRVWWTCFIIDTWASGGSNLSRQFKFELKQPRVPMDETVFFHMKQGDPDVSIAEWKPGLWGHMVKLVEIYVQIQDLNKHLVETAEWDEDSIEDAVRDLAVALVAFEQNLEPEIRYSEVNLARHVSKGLGRTFMAFHLGYHHYCTLLFYQYLDHNRPFTINGKAYADRCKLHATIFCDILKASREQKGAEALYNIVGHITVVSSSVLLHTYLFGEAHELPDSRRRLESNLESLVQLRSYWSSVELMIKRLVIFQNNCMRSLSRNTHRFDRWMVKFLSEHALALDEKTDELPNPWLATGLETMAESTRLERSRVTQSIITNMQNLEYI
ncbi:hypothetical protein BP5796_09865 [Coleophoma crateriformis]|uniref:Xylanolytic transcriptional activator regulatory domain-containing protein n=1 Tax=Coleophoma crateriformis TaxID=565419 RepID=A0A3D8QTM0_9HELO|nr:hypothetical protein BP5796_09865 [Coleophoma crateriformis]